ncbi:MAG TPA: hypothetical protein VIY29_07940 [Ktedonobacteraceae bacterium]
MMNEVLSFFVWCRHDQQTDAMKLQVVSADTGNEVRLNEGSFLLRIFSLEDGTVQRCFIRHIASGREAYMQGGIQLRTFVKECMLQGREPASESSVPEEPEELSGESRTSEPGSRSESPAPDNEV